MSEEGNKDIALFFNIGNRDVKIGGEIIPKEDRGAKKFSITTTHSKRD